MTYSPCEHGCVRAELRAMGDVIDHQEPNLFPSLYLIMGSVGHHSMWKPYLFFSVVFVEKKMRNLKLLRAQECQPVRALGTPQGFTVRADRGTVLISTEYGIVELDPVTQEVRVHILSKIRFLDLKNSLTSRGCGRKTR